MHFPLDRVTLLTALLSLTIGCLGTDDEDIVDNELIGDEPACSLTASRASAAPGSTITLSWTTRAATSGRVLAGNRVLTLSPSRPSGSLTTILPTTPTKLEYVMVVANDSHTRTCAAPVVVTGGTDVLFDLSPSVLVPTHNPKHITFISSETNERLETRSVHACELTYWKRDGVVHKTWTSYPEVAGSVDVSDHILKQKNAWRIVTHHGNTRPCDPGSTVSRTDVTTGTDLIRVESKRRANGHVAHGLTFGANALTMRAKETTLAEEFFGLPWFYKQTTTTEDKLARKEIKLNQYVDLAYEPRAIADYENLVLMFDARPMHLGYIYPPAEPSDPAFVDRERSDPTRICVKGTPSRHAAVGRPCITTEDGGGTKYRIANLDLAWRDDRCPKRIDTDPVCRWQGMRLGFVLDLSDGRHEFQSDDTRSPFFRDPETQQWMYRYDLKEVLPAGTTQNPFKKVGLRTRIEKNILPEMRDALLLALSQNPTSCTNGSDPSTCFVPPKLPGESTGQYIEHYTLQNGQIGYEITSLSDLSYEVYALSLRGKKLPGR